jgi:hypothetical protein
MPSLLPPTLNKYIFEFCLANGSIFKNGAESGFSKVRECIPRIRRSETVEVGCLFKGQAYKEQAINYLFDAFCLVTTHGRSKDTPVSLKLQNSNPRTSQVIRLSFVSAFGSEPFSLRALSYF